MNQKDFLKKLNKKDTSISYSDVTAFLDTQYAVVTYKRSNIFSQIFNKFIKRKNPTDVIKSNMNAIIEKININDLRYIFQDLQKSSNFGNISKEYFLPIWSRYLNSDMPVSTLTRIFSDFFANSQENRAIVDSNIDGLLEYMNPLLFFELSQHLKYLSSSVRDKLNEYYEVNKESVIKSILHSNCKGKENDINIYIPSLSKVFDELLESEKCEYTDIKIIGMDRLNRAYKIGDKVVKLGHLVSNYTIPNHRRILQPLIRTNFTGQNGNSIALLEISEHVDTDLHAKDVDFDSLYSIYKELRDDGIIWTDLAPINLGKLKKPNHTYLNGEIVTPDASSRGFDKNITEDVLDTDDLVIINTNFIYSENDQNIVWRSTPRKFEERYLKEKYQTNIEEQVVLEDKSTNNSGDEPEL